jgi:Uma2 family endonuclease
MSSPALARLTVQQYHRMIDARVLTEKDRIELLEGWLVEKMTHHPPAAASITRLHGLLLSRLPQGWIIRVQLPITTADSEPEPDVAVARGPLENYDTRHPGARDVGLVVEVADTTLAQDRGMKSRLYARARIPTYWIVNIPEQQLEVHTRPMAGKAPRYRDRQLLGLSESASFALEDAIVGPLPVAGMFPGGPTT